MKRRDPDPVGNERTTLEQFLDYQRATLLHKTDGLTADQMRQHLPTSTLTLAGLLKHRTAVACHAWQRQRADSWGPSHL